MLPARRSCRKPKSFSDAQIAVQLCKDNLYRDQDSSLHILLAICYIEAKGVEKDVSYARELIQKAADRGNEEAASMLTHFRKNIFGGYTFQ